MLTFYLTFYLTYILTFYLEYLTYILTVYLTFFLAFCLTYVLAFYLAIFLAFYLTCVRVQSRSSTGSGAGCMEFGPRRVDRSRRASIRSSRHGVRVQACSAASGAGGEVRGFGSQGTARAEMRRRRRRRSCTLVKIWRPSLAGVEKPNLSLFPLSA